MPASEFHSNFNSYLMLELEPSLNFCCLFVHTCSSKLLTCWIMLLKTPVFHWNGNSVLLADDMSSVQCTQVYENPSVL